MTVSTSISIYDMEPYLLINAVMDEADAPAQVAE